MVTESMSGRDWQAVSHALKAICEGPFLDDAEFQTRVGVSREKVAALLQQWPHVDDSGEEEHDTTIAINNTLNELCYGVDISDEEWARWLKISRGELIKVFKKWASARRRTSQPGPS